MHPIRSLDIMFLSNNLLIVFYNFVNYRFQIIHAVFDAQRAMELCPLMLLFQDHFEKLMVMILLQFETDSIQMRL